MRKIKRMAAFLRRMLRDVPLYFRCGLHYFRVKSYAKSAGFFCTDKELRAPEDVPLSTFGYLDSMILSKLHLLQFGMLFQEAKFLTTNLGACGFGAAVPVVLGKCLAYSYLYDRTLLFDDSRLVYDYCYEPISSHHIEDINEECRRRTVEFNFLPQQEKAVHRFGAMLGFFENNGLVARHFNFVYPAAPQKYSMWYIRGLILDKFLKLKQEYKEHVEEKRKELGLKSPVIGMHIRRGDAVTEQYRYFPFQTYLEAVKQVVNKTGINTVFVTTDSEEVIRQLPQNSGIDFIYDDKEKHYNVSVAAMLRDRLELRKQETLTAVKNIYLLADCDYIIGSHRTSWFSVAQAISFYRKKKLNGIVLSKTGGTCRLNYVCSPPTLQNSAAWYRKRSSSG